MKIKTFLLILVACICVAISALAENKETYKQLWSEVKAAEKKDLPRDGIKICEEIYAKANAENNEQQMLKAFLYRMDLRGRIDNDSIKTDVNYLKDWQQRETRPVLKAVLSYYFAQQYHNDDKDSIGLAYIRKSLADKDKLAASTSTSSWQDIVNKGVKSDYFAHDMYHLLITSDINLLGDDRIKTQNIVKNIYHDAITFYHSHNNIDGELLLTIDSLDYAKNHGLNYNAYYTNMNVLKMKFTDYPVCAQVYSDLADQATDQKHYKEAYGLLTEAISKYPSYKNINELKNKISDIKQSEGTVNDIPSILYPGDPLKVKVTYRNLNSIKLLLYKSDKKYSTNEKDLRIIGTYYFNLKTNNDYAEQDTIFTLPALEVGYYSIKANYTIKNYSAYSPINVSRLFMLNRNINGKIETVVLDGKSGQPVKGAKVEIFNRNDNNKSAIASYTADSDGTCSYTLPKQNKNYSIKVSKDDDWALPDMPTGNYYYNNYYRNNQSTENTKIQLFTDRVIYRPGQTVQVKGVVYTQTGDDAAVCAGQSYSVELHDANNKQIAENKVTTNEFGSFNTEFTLPTHSLNGRFYIRTGSNGFASIDVEEYKRPTFEMKIDEYKKAYKLGDTVNLTGTAKTYSGLAMEGDSIKYTVTRRARTLWWWWRNNSSTAVVQTSSAAVKNDGTFDMPVTLIPDSINDFYSYTVDASVTDINGETEKAEYTLSAGKKAVILSTDLPYEVNVDSVIEGKFIAVNPQDNNVSETIKARLLHEGKEVWRNNNILSNTKIQLSEWKSLTPGKYILQISDSTNEKPIEKALVVFSEHSSVMPVDTVMWYKQLNSEFPKDGKAATILFGTSHPNTYVIYSVLSKGNIIDSKRLTLNNELRSFNYTYNENYGDGIFVQFCFVVDGITYQKGFTITKPLPDKSLSIKWSRFRDKLQPGKKETWSLTILNNKNNPANAEMMATLYDASLDVFRKYSPNNKLSFSRFVTEYNWENSYNEFSSIGLPFSVKEFPISFLYDNFIFSNTRDTPYLSIENGLRKEVINIANAKESNALNEVVAIGYGKASIASLADRMVISRAPTMLSKSVMAGVMTEEEQQPAPSIPTQSLRTNFNETAFFYPQLTTDAGGNITFSFTMPESLTRWNFIGLAHTKDMQTGIISGSTVTAKDFMITPNLPRFVRVGDKVSIGVRINNTSNAVVEGKATMQLFNPEDNKVISTQTVPFNVPKTGETSVTFSFDPIEKYTLLGVKIIAESGNFSDGEQQLLPVLSNKEYVTETVPMFVRGHQTKTFDISSLFNNHSQTATQRKMVVECTGNPAWYAVQALPTLSEPTNDDAISWGAAWYANNLATYIANGNPHIKQIFDTWRAEGADSQTLWSKLQKDEDVKNLVLEESPWVAEANTQKEQQQRVATLFDVNNMTYQLTRSINKLQQLQQPDGGWAWFPGMQSGMYTTMYIVQLMSQCNQLTGNNDVTISNMRDKGMAFIHKNIKDDYDEYIKIKTKPQLGDTQVEYLYLCALTGNNIPQNTEAAYNYYIKLAEKSSPDLTMLGKAVMSYVMKCAHKDKIAADMIESLRQYAVRTEDGGAFYNPSADRYSWWGNPLATQTAVIEAFNKVAHDSTFVDELQIALLKRKQAQSWGNTVSTANAVYALLCNGNNMLSDNGECKLTLEGKSVKETVQPEKQEAGTGYYRTEITNENARDNATGIKFEKDGTGVAWGAVYGGSLENIDKFGNNGNALTVTKTYLLNGKPVNEWHIGDRITSRLTIHIDRDMDYIQISDERPACAEPGIATSGYRWSNGFGYYQCIKDASTRIFFDRLTKGTYTIEYDCTVDRTGNYQSGLTTLQSAYAPEFAAHSVSTVINVK